MNTPNVEQFLSDYSPEVRDLALQARALTLDVIPDAIELVDPSSRINRQHPLCVVE
jgi:hypothetical protein